jgi:peroxiredoxin
VEKQLGDFSAARVRPVAISVDQPQVSLGLSKKAGYTFTMLSDPDTATIRNYHLLHTAGGPSGTDISRPAEFLVDQNGIIRWTNFTEDIRVRARANEMLAEARKIN